MRHDLDHALALHCALVHGVADGDALGPGEAAKERNTCGENVLPLRGDRHVHALVRRDVHLGAAGTDGRNRVLDQLHRFLVLREGQLVAPDGPVAGHDELALVRDGLPDLLGDERHERVQQPQDLVEHIDQHALRGELALLVLAVEARLRQLDIPVAICVPDEVIDLGRGNAQLVGVHILGHFTDERIQLREDPLVLDLQLIERRQARFVDGQVHQHIAARVPDLVGKVAHRLALFNVEAHVVAGRVASDEVEAQRIRAKLLRHLQRIDAVAERFGHLAALVVADEAVDEDSLERLFLHLLHPGEHHAGHPEEDDVIARDHIGRRIPVFEVLRVQIGPAERGERPECRGEPGVEHVLVARQVRAAALFALRRILAADVDVAALITVPRRDLMAPPELAGDAPVVDVFHPVDIDLREPLRHELDRPVLHDADGLLGQRRHLHEPLRGDDRLHVVVAAIAGADVVGIGLGLHEIALGLEIGHDGLAALITVQTAVFAAVFVHLAVVVEDADNLEIVPQADLKVVRVVRRGHLDRAGAEADLAVLIAHDRNFAVHDRQDAGLADEVLEFLVLGVDGDAGVAHHGLGARRRDNDVAAAIAERIADIPEMAGLVNVFDLRVRERRHAVRAPVDNAAALVDEALVIKLAERLAHGLRAAFVHRKAGTRPVAADAELLLLLDDAAAVLFLPCPHALEELFTAEVITRQPFLRAKLFFDLDLCGDARMVGAWEPERAVALHALIARQDVLQRGVQRVAHVELSGDVGGRHDDGIGRLVRVDLGLEAAVFHPHLVDLVFDLFRVILFR